MTELKPCPFCGGNAKLVEYWLKGVCNTKHFFVQCKQCGVRKDNHHNGYKTREKAIDGWNERAKMDLPESMVYPQIEGITPTVVKIDEVTE